MNNRMRKLINDLYESEYEILFFPMGQELRIMEVDDMQTAIKVIYDIERDDLSIRINGTILREDSNNMIEVIAFDVIRDVLKQTRLFDK